MEKQVQSSEQVGLQLTLSRKIAKQKVKVRAQVIKLGLQVYMRLTAYPIWMCTLS